MAPVLFILRDPQDVGFVGAGPAIERQFCPIVTRQKVSIDRYFLSGLIRHSRAAIVSDKTLRGGRGRFLNRRNVYRRCPVTSPFAHRPPWVRRNWRGQV